MESPRNIIEVIRREEFGIGLQTNDAVIRRVIEQQNLRLNRALAQLSEDLYTKDIHFVLELIQNADDNSYKPRVKPWLRFTINRESVVVQNNEIGFTEANVRALCDVGKTTKRKALGYIGEKGIGFKSVFRVSDEPQIFSNGFQFGFKRGDERGKLGFVLPHWVESTSFMIDETLTNIVLKLRKEAKEEISKFDEIEPTLLLFLNKLRVIEIENRTHGKAVKRVEKRVGQSGTIEIKHSKGTEHWRLVRKEIPISKEIREKKRQDIEKTDIVLAFPLNPDGSADGGTERQAFAYLPIRPYGFKFVIQADFLVPANREDILWDRTWNKHIRENITKAFALAIEIFKKDKNLKHSFYDYIPLPDHVKDNFFSPVVPNILDCLRVSKCILSESGRWRKPEEVLLADTETRALITNGDLKRLIGKEYVATSVKTKREILDSLGVDVFDFSLLIQCLANEGWLRKKSDEWLIKLYKFLSGKSTISDNLEVLRRLKIIRLESRNQLASIDEDAIFFPLSARTTYGFEGDLRIVKRKLVHTKRRSNRQKSGTILDTLPMTRKFLTDLGVENPNALEIIEKHILPIYQSDEWKTKGSPRLFGYIQYVKDHLDEYEKENRKRLAKENKDSSFDPLKHIKQTLWIRNSNPEGQYYSRAGSLYLSKAYYNPNELESLFKGIEDIQYVSDDYVTQYFHDVPPHGKYRLHAPGKHNSQSSSWRAISEWRRFFVELGVNQGFRLIPTNSSHLTSHELKELRALAYDWSTYYRDTDPTGSSTINYQLEPLSQVLEIFEKKPTVAKSQHILNVLESQWKELAAYTRLAYRWTYYRPYGPQYTDATWLHMLKRARWLPSIEGKRRVFASPAEVFLDKPDIRDVLGTTVPYLLIEIISADIVKALDIHTGPTVRAVLNLIGSLSDRGQRNKSKLAKLYAFLDDRCAEQVGVILEAFSNKQLILVPRSLRGWYTKEEVFWKDVTSIFGDSRGCLERHYPGLKQFFLHKLGIKERPTPSDYIKLLVAIAAKEDLREEDESIIITIYQKLNWHLRTEGQDSGAPKTEWLSDLTEKYVLLTDKNGFWRNDGDVFVNDDPELYELFRQAPEVAFMKIPYNFHPRIQYFLGALEITLLSQTVVPELITEGTRREEPEATYHIHSLVPYIERYLYSMEYDAYEALKTAGKLETLRELEVCTVDNLQVKYVLSNVPSPPVARDAIFYDRTLLVRRECLSEGDAVAIEIARMLGSMRGLDDFLVSLFEKRTPEKIERLLRSKHIPPLPTDEPESFVQKIESRTEERGDGSESPELPEAPVELESTTQSREIEQASEPPALLPDPNGTIGRTTKPAEGEKHLAPEVPISTANDWRRCEPSEAGLNRAVKYATPPQVSRISGEPKQEPIELSHKELSSRPDEKESDESHKPGRANLAEIGRWGEEYALRCLCEELISKYPTGIIEETEYGFEINDSSEIVAELYWLNKVTERGEHYDIRQVEKGVEVYYEVKSTTTLDKEWFELSHGQWELSRQVKAKYHLYRVYGAGSFDPPAPIDITSPFELWEAGELDANPVMIRI